MQPLTLNQYKALPDHRKIILLENEGIYLEVNRIEGGKIVGLYSLYAFYVEVRLNSRRNKVEHLSAFSSYYRLDPFLNSINISSLFNSQRKKG